MGWEAANARARGLATHLLTRESLMQATAAGSWESAARTLAARGYPLAERDLQSRLDLDLGIGRIVAGRFGLLRRWRGPRGATLPVLFLLDERRSLRRLLRGVAQGASVEHRLSGLTPTPGLPEALLRRLARASSLDGLAIRLQRAGHPAGRVLSTGARRTRSLWDAELALDHLFARMMTDAARPGGRMLRRFTALWIDLENAWSLLAAREWGADVVPRDVFLPGGLVLSLETFTATAADRAAGASWRRVAQCFAPTPLAPAFGEPAPPAELERTAEMALVAWMRDEARRDPLSVSTVLGVGLRIRMEAHDVRLVIFAADLGVPPSAIAPMIETAA